MYGRASWLGEWVGWSEDNHSSYGYIEVLLHYVQSFERYRQLLLHLTNTRALESLDEEVYMKA